jgi:hypothetical protein
MHLRGKRVLYLDVDKTIYTEGIKEAFERNENSVDFFTYNDFHGNRFKRKLDELTGYNRERNKRINEMFNYIKTKHYDIILIKAPFRMEHEFFQKLINYFPKTFKINYNWSSVETFNFLPYKNYFDKIYSFDINDCEKYGLNYYPLFYLPEFEKAGLYNHKKYDISFVGSCFNEGRFEFLQSFINYIRLEGLKYKFYLYSPSIKQNLKVLFTNPSMMRYIGIKFLPLNAVIKIMKNSSSMIDYPMDTQSGLTMRTFETISAGLLLITTNENIKKEPFYRPEIIKVINSDLSDLNLEWIKEFTPKWDSSFEEYSINNWINKITEY